MKSNRTARRGFEQLERRELFASDLLLSRSAGEQGPCLPVEEGLPVYISYQPDPRFLTWKGGNVTAEVKDGVLIVRGDAKGNLLSIEAIDASTYKVTGSNMVTKLNGSENLAVPAGRGPTQTFTGVISLDIDLRDGDDEMMISGAAIRGSSIKLGAGNDSLVFGGIAEDPYYAWIAIKLREPVQIDVQGNLTIDGGAGNDQFIPFAKVQGNLLVQLGAGDDSFIELAYPTLTAGTKIRSEITATGTRVIDLGTDQSVNDIPVNWRDDPRMEQVIAWGLPYLFEQLKTAIATGTLVPGSGVTNWYPSEGSRPYEVNADGRMRVQFMYLPGFARVLERLRERGVKVIEANSDVDLGSGEAWINGADLVKFANLPGLIKIDQHGSISFQLDYRDPNEPWFDFPQMPTVMPDPPPPYVPPGGNVTVEVIDGVLTIRGDAKTNKIEVIPSGAGFVVRSIYQYSLINGQLAAHPPHSDPIFTGVTSIDIDLGDGDDEVTIAGNKPIPGLSIRTGNGDDYVRLGGNIDDPFAAVSEQWIQFGYEQLINGNVVVDTGAGDDLFIPYAHVNGSVNVQLGAGNDSNIDLTYNAKLDPVTGYSIYEPYLATFTADDGFVVELGTDQNLETVVDNWRSDHKLLGKIDYEPQVWPQISLDPTEIDFSFLPGDEHFIERLQARGLEIDAYTVEGGLGRAKIHGADDFKVFTGLTSLARISMAGRRNEGVVDFAWEFERPETTEPIVPGPTPPETTSPDPGPTTGPIQGPPRLEDIPLRGPNNPPESLFESYYRSKVFGPQRPS